MPTDSHHITDEQLVARFRTEGDRTALGILYKRYAHLVLGLCLDYLKNREEAKDTVMDIFAKVTVKLPDHEVDNFRPWLFFVSRNHCLDILRKRVKAPKDEFLTEAFMEIPADERPEEDKRLEMLSDAIGTLKDHQRQCIVGFYLQGQTYEQLSERSGFTIKQVKSYLQNGRRNLKNTLIKWQDERAEK
ncbi:MAG: sigma-70 family RNA polymerase sigma factor [Bacteroidota bacterium]